MVYHCILQVHSILSMISSCLVTAPTSFICCKARLATSVLSFMCLHTMYTTKVITNNEIITVTNRKTFIMKLFKNKFLLGKSESVLVSLSVKYKFPFYDGIGEQSLSVSWVLLSESNLDTLRDMGKVCSKVVLSIRMETSKESVKWSNKSR